MTRSFGDALAHTVGCVATPDLFDYKLQPEDKMMVIASDGIWEFLTNEEVSEIVYPFYFSDEPEKAAQTLIRAAYDRWTEVESGCIDDITCVVIFFSE